jgi:hypothetical protein
METLKTELLQVHWRSSELHRLHDRSRPSSSSSSSSTPPTALSDVPGTTPSTSTSDTGTGTTTVGVAAAVSRGVPDGVPAPVPAPAPGPVVRAWPGTGVPGAADPKEGRVGADGDSGVPCAAHTWAHRQKGNRVALTVLWCDTVHPGARRPQSVATAQGARERTKVCRAGTRPPPEYRAAARRAAAAATSAAAAARSRSACSSACRAAMAPAGGGTDVGSQGVEPAKETGSHSVRNRGVRGGVPEWVGEGWRGWRGWCH